MYVIMEKAKKEVSAYVLRDAARGPGYSRFQIGNYRDEKIWPSASNFGTSHQKGIDAVAD